MIFPKCCRNCIYLDAKFAEDCSLVEFCRIGVAIPTKKGTCKKQVKLYREETRIDKHGKEFIMADRLAGS